MPIRIIELYVTESNIKMTFLEQNDWLTELVI